MIQPKVKNALKENQCHNFFKESIWKQKAKVRSCSWKWCVKKLEWTLSRFHSRIFNIKFLSWNGTFYMCVFYSFLFHKKASHYKKRISCVCLYQKSEFQILAEGICCLSIPCFTSLLRSISWAAAVSGGVGRYLTQFQYRCWNSWCHLLKSMWNTTTDPVDRPPSKNLKHKQGESWQDFSDKDTNVAISPTT